MSRNKLHRILKVLAPLFALICALLCALSFTYSFDKDIGYFTNSPLTYVFYVSIGLAIITSIAAAVTAQTDKSEEYVQEPRRRTMGIIMLCSFSFYLISFLFAPAQSHISSIMFILIVVGALISAIHFATVSLCDGGTNAKIFTGLAVVLTPIIIATASYFDHSQPLNSPHKLLLEFALAAFSLYYITELRLYTSAPRRKLLIAISGISTALSLCGGVSIIFEISRNSNLTMLNISLAILLATMASCSASKLLEP